MENRQPTSYKKSPSKRKKRRKLRPWVKYTIAIIIIAGIGWGIGKLFPYHPFTDADDLEIAEEIALDGDEFTWESYDNIQLPDPNQFTIPKGARYHDRVPTRRIGRLPEIFNDSNHQQLLHAESLGIDPIRSLEDAYRTKRPLIRIESNEFYEVDELKHSMPYLVPESAALLKLIGRNFIDSLGRRGADGYRIMVTSLLRTPQTVRRLRRVNVNATETSAHMYGTTFDLSYTRFACKDSMRTINEEDLKNLLAEVLLDLRRQEKCMVKYEGKTGCFHITVQNQDIK